mmetsp:Transcript_9398/g.13592  ORF Transcript_9398/g.13592 Transcript_9398/m.13592 type:complete len:92 (-) Transcript_9398:34-309(-)
MILLDAQDCDALLLLVSAACTIRMNLLCFAANAAVRAILNAPRDGGNADSDDKGKQTIEVQRIDRGVNTLVIALLINRFILLLAFISLLFM